MPLIHSKTPKAFKENISREMHAGKPQKQAVAIAYSTKRRAEEHKADGGCVGSSCQGCSDANCASDYSDTMGGKAVAQAKARNYQPEPQPSQKPGGKMVFEAEGGAVDSWTKREDNERGVNRGWGGNNGYSQAGMHARTAHYETDSSDKEDSLDAARREHHKTLGEMRSMPKPKLMAEGGEVHEDAEQDHEMIDSEIHNMMGEELMSAIDAKDKKRIMESLEAIVLQCMNKE